MRSLLRQGFGGLAFALPLLALAFAGPCVAETIAITGARIETVAASGPIASGVVVIKDGRIVAVGPSVPVPQGARVIDAAGKVVTPGLIAPSTNLGIAETEQVRSTRDDHAGQALSAGFDVQYGFNPASSLIPLARDGGVTRIVITPQPSGNGEGGDEETAGGSDYTAGGPRAGSDPVLFTGQPALVTLTAGDVDPVLRAKVAVSLDLGQAGAANAGGSRGTAMVLVRSALDDARNFARNRAGFEKGASRPYGLSRMDLEALVPVVEGRTPLLVRVHRASDIREVLKLAAEQKIKLILEGAEEGWIVAPELARAGVPVMIDSEADLPDQFESLGSRLDNAARLQAAGVTVAIEGSREFFNLRQQRFNAGTAVANGLPYQAALASITLNPAKIWGVSDKAGSIEPGKDADLVIWSGDPLETTTYPVAVVIGGVVQPTQTRALELRDRYLNPDQTYPPAYH
jgi:imidazolonepropionase-like amidohydrolase